jgi:hypothetical protein
MTAMTRTRGAVVVVLLLVNVTGGGAIDGFSPTGFFDEQAKQWTTDDDVRVLLTAPGDFDPSRPTHLVLFALPNGNTIEWTLGAQLRPGMDWHYDIQHVGAQIRKLRQVTPGENVVLALLEADKRSWPAWRKAHTDNAKRIRHLVHQVSRAVPGPASAKKLTLSAHSGGGAFLFGYLDGAEAIDDHIVRFAWIDANYGYDDAQHHGDKLLAWLKADAARRLIVIAYDDRDVKLGGKNIVSPTGGTYRASHRMIDRLGKDVTLVQSKRDEFESFTDAGGQVHVLVHINPQWKILHTVLVERNGLLEALTLGTPAAGKWDGRFWGERAYADLIQPAPAATQPATTTASGTIPSRPSNAPGGKAFAESIADLPPQAREAAIYQEIARGNVPSFLRTFHPITVGFVAPDGTKHSATYHVAPDYLAVGADNDFLRVPLTPATATRLSAFFDCALPTRKIVNDVYANATVRLEPQPLGPPRETVETFVKHNVIIEEQRRGKPGDALIAGIKKDVVISNRLKEKPNRVAIYGWHKPDGKPIQPLYVGHAESYVDYSHGIRLVKREMTIDGRKVDAEDVLKDPKLCGALSDEGPIDARYP